MQYRWGHCARQSDQQVTAQPSFPATWRSVAVLFATGALLLGLAAFAIWYSGPDPAPVPSPSVILDQCTKQILGDSKTNLVASIASASQVCFEHSSRALYVEDFRIRREAFELQQFQGIVLLWMVVAITLSGVALAALQLLAAFRLASVGIGPLASDGEVSLEQGKVSLKSSVTGLLILVVSLAFFGIYVIGVYTLDDGHGAPSLVGPQPTTMLSGGGGLGPPPPSGTPATAPSS